MLCLVLSEVPRKEVQEKIEIRSRSNFLPRKAFSNQTISNKTHRHTNTLFSIICPIWSLEYQVCNRFTALFSLTLANRLFNPHQCTIFTHPYLFTYGTDMVVFSQDKNWKKSLEFGLRAGGLQLEREERQSHSYYKSSTRDFFYKRLVSMISSIDSARG